MFTLTVFIVSLTLVVFLVLIKDMEIARGRNFASTNLFSVSDAWIIKKTDLIKIWWAKVNFNNTKLIFSKIIVSIRGLITSFKRRFDHKHSPFFAKKEQDFPKNKGSVSFFLKDISEHKKTLRDK